MLIRWIGNEGGRAQGFVLQQAQKDGCNHRLPYRHHTLGSCSRPLRRAPASAPTVRGHGGESRFRAAVARGTARRGAADRGQRARRTDQASITVSKLLSFTRSFAAAHICAAVIMAVLSI